MAANGTPASPTSAPIDVEAQSSPRSPKSHRLSTGLVRESTDLERRRPKRSRTAKTYRPKIRGRTWLPGLEPGIDPAGSSSSSSLVDLVARCEITVVDFSERDMQVEYLDNATLADFLVSERPDSQGCRWISVNGLSWDVVSLLGTKFGLHRLAIEDVLNRRNRTKADWYADHLYLVMPLQKLVHSDHDQQESDDNSDVEDDPPKVGSKKSSLAKRVQGLRKPQRPNLIRNPATDHPLQGQNPRPGDIPPRTLQGYHSGPNEDHTEYMEYHSALREKKLAVGVEQVSLFLTADGTVITFFEHSADDVETPLVQRLGNPKTVLRRANDASMLVQAIMDAIIDLAIPVGVAYGGAMSQIELDVLTNPAIKHTTALYIVTSEISLFRSSISPVLSLIDVLRNRGTDKTLPPPSIDRPDAVPVAITISPRTRIYLKDVEDHIVLITENLDEMRRAADAMISLIFNTISAYQNEAMRNLTLVTIFFLPLTFLTGYFGMNFSVFQGVQDNSDAYFWIIAAPVLFVVTIWLLRDVIWRWYILMLQRYGIRSRRKARLNSVRGLKTD